MNNFAMFIILMLITMNSYFVLNHIDHRCDLPSICRIEWTHDLNFETNEKYYSKTISIICDINNDGYEFSLKEISTLNKSVLCYEIDDRYERIRSFSDILHLDFNSDFSTIVIIFKSASKEQTIFGNNFNLSNAITYFSYFKIFLVVRLWEMKGFEVNFLDNRIFHQHLSLIGIKIFVFISIILIYYLNDVFF